MGQTSGGELTNTATMTPGLVSDMRRSLGEPQKESILVPLMWYAAAK